jgi:3-isopropylmalate/(R)-2-methylmalate dehydratase small subunit
MNGRARVFGDDINTDYIITSRRKRESIAPNYLRDYLFEELDPGFASTLLASDFLVGGKNFGCGSAMEVAVTAVVGAGIRAVIASSFSRTYYRNAVNNGLIPILCDTSSINEGDLLEIDWASKAEVWNRTQGTVLSAEPINGIMHNILAAGGLVPYFRLHGGFQL